MRRGCLDRTTLLAVASGRCPRERLPEVQRHLAGCARCRASVVAAASGVRGPGETVFLGRRQPRERRWPKRVAVVASVLAVAAAWFYGTSPPAPEPGLAQPDPASPVQQPLVPRPSVEVRALQAGERTPRAEALPSSDSADTTRYVGVSVVAPEPDANAQRLP